MEHVQYELPFITAYSVKPRVQKHFEGDSLTKQEFKAECDINNILASYNRQMGVDFLAQYQGQVSGRFGDVSQVPDYQEALQTIEAANELFDAMPSKLRSRFENNPEHLLAFLADERNRDEAIQLGLISSNPSSSSSISQAPESKEAT